jgi:hypothetical protein
LTSGSGRPQAGRRATGAEVNSIGMINETAVKGADCESRPAVGEVGAEIPAQCNRVGFSETGVPTMNEAVGYTVSSGAGIVPSASVSSVRGESPIKSAELHYLDVGSDCCWKALQDSGSEIDVVNRSKLMQLLVPRVIAGNVLLRLMAGPAIPAELVEIQVRLIEQSGQATDFVSIVAAACEDLHNDLILSQPTVQRLTDRWHNDTRVLCNDDTGSENDGNNELDDVNSHCDYSTTSTAVNDVITTIVTPVNCKH